MKTQEEELKELSIILTNAVVRLNELLKPKKMTFGEYFEGVQDTMQLDEAYEEYSKYLRL